jgi:hypothetical protein
MLLIDDKKVFVHSVHTVPGFPHLIRVFVSSDGVRPASQHDIPAEGKFRTNGHLYEWRDRPLPLPSETNEEETK